MSKEDLFKKLDDVMNILRDVSEMSGKLIYDAKSDVDANSYDIMESRLISLRYQLKVFKTDLEMFGDGSKYNQIKE